MIQLHQSLEGKPVVMLSVSVDKEGAPIINTYFKNVFDGKIPPFAILLDPSASVAKTYKSLKYPETFILDPQGRVRDKIEGVLEWNNRIVQSYLLLLAGQKSF